MTLFSAFVMFSALLLFVAWLARDARKHQAATRHAIDEVCYAVNRLVPKPNRTRRTAVVLLNGARAPSSDGEDAARECEGQKVELLPGESVTLQLFPQWSLLPGGTITIDAPGFYLQAVTVGQRHVGTWTRGVFSLPEIRLGTVVTVGVFRVEDAP